MRLRHLHSILKCLRPQPVETILVDAAIASGRIASSRFDMEGATILNKSSLPEVIARLRFASDRQLAGMDSQPQCTVLIIHAPQNLAELRCDPIQSIGRPAGDGVATDFEWLIRQGPAMGVHCILLTERPGIFAHSVDPRGKIIELFDLRVATRMVEDEARKVIPDGKVSRLDELGAMLYVRSDSPVRSRAMLAPAPALEASEPGPAPHPLSPEIKIPQVGGDVAHDHPVTPTRIILARGCVHGEDLPGTGALACD